ncbi:MAG: hypothetical protein IPQ07_19615 [Myxococcales bacterium]|nr:hypothetical protein [Myxococcales bacterium]
MWPDFFFAGAGAFCDPILRRRGDEQLEAEIDPVILGEIVGLEGRRGERLQVGAIALDLGVVEVEGPVLVRDQDLVLADISVGLRERPFGDELLADGQRPGPLQQACWGQARSGLHRLEVLGVVLLQAERRVVRPRRILGDRQIVQPFLEPRQISVRRGLRADHTGAAGDHGARGDLPRRELALLLQSSTDLGLEVDRPGRGIGRALEDVRGEAARERAAIAIAVGARDLIVLPERLVDLERVPARGRPRQSAVGGRRRQIRLVRRARREQLAVLHVRRVVGGVGLVERLRDHIVAEPLLRHQHDRAHVPGRVLERRDHVVLALRALEQLMGEVHRAVAGAVGLLALARLRIAPLVLPLLQVGLGRHHVILRSDPGRCPQP